MRHEGETVFQQLPSRHAQKPWAFFIILFVLVAFGAFWYYERSREVIDPPIINTAPITRTTPQPESIQMNTDSPIQAADLQAAAINTAIPEYSEQF